MRGPLEHVVVPAEFSDCQVMLGDLLQGFKQAMETFNLDTVTHNST